MVIGFHKSTEPFEFDDSHWFGYEKPSVLEAFRVLAKEGYYVTISGHDYDMRKKRLQKEYEKNTKAPGPGEEQPEEKKGIIYPSTFPKADFYYKHVLNEGNPALKEAASQFNDALLDEQAKKIVSLEEKCKKYAYIVDSLEGKLRELKAENRRIKDSDLNLEGLTYATRELKEKNKKIDELTKENEELKSWCENQNREISLNTISFTNEAKRLGREIARLNKNIYKKNMKIEELRKGSSRHLRGKIKMFGENVDLEQMLKDKDAVLADVAEELRLSKIREKNLTEVSQKYMKENEELKNELDAFKKSYKRRLKEDSEHFEHIQKICNVGLQKWLLESEYLEKDKPFRFPQLPDFNEEEEKKHSLFRDDSVGAVTNQKDCSPVKDTHPTVDIAEGGGDHSAIIARCCKNIAISKDEAEIIERCTKDGTELHYSEKDGFTYTNMFGDEMPIICLSGMFQVFTDEEIKNMKK